MDEAIIRQWNSQVQVGDIVHFLGDFTLKTKRDYITNILCQLKGTIKFYPGNHDKGMRRLFKEQETDKMLLPHGSIRLMPEIYRFKHNKQLFLLSHYPIKEWGHETFHLHGHSHGALRGRETPRSMDIGWDIEHRLFTLEEIIKLLESQEADFRFKDGK